MNYDKILSKNTLQPYGTKQYISVIPTEQSDEESHYGISHYRSI